MNIFTFLFDAITLTVCILATARCGQEIPQVQLPTPAPTAAADASAPAPIVVATATPTPAPTAAPIYITYHSVTVTRQPNPNKFYTATGYCLVYSGKTYCWDDGIHTISYTNFPPTTGYYTYWGLGCNGTCQVDKALQPTLVNPVFVNQIFGPGASVSAVLSGAGTTVSCTDSAGVLSCGIFSVDTNQVGL